MKKMKRLAALFLAVVMVMAMGLTTMAAPGDTKTGSIVVNGANKEGVYKAFKVFDATATDDGQHASYTVSGKALTHMNGLADKDTGEIKDKEGIVLFTLVNNGGTTYVNVGDKTKAAGWIQTHINDLVDIDMNDSSVPTATKNEEAKTATFTGLTYGYYYITTETELGGTAVMLASVDSGTITINEKHGEPGFDKTKPGEGKHAKDGYTYEIGKIITYEVQFSNALNYVNGDLIKQYNITDKLASGTTLVPNSIKATVNDGTENVFVASTAEADKGKVIGHIDWSKPGTDDQGNAIVEPKYSSAPSVIKIEYKVTVEKGFTAGNAGAENKIEIAYETVSGKKPGTPPSDTEKVYTGKVSIEKTDDKTKEPLAGAEFVISKVEDGVTKYMTKDKTTGVIDWAAKAENQAVVDITNIYKETTVIKEENGVKKATASFEGMKEGDYTLEEVKAPDGYNLPTNGTSIKLTVTETKKADDSLNPTVEVVMEKTEGIANNQGVVLPSTGGIGTTIFYVVGGILVLGAGVLLITKKRMSAK